jgi:cation:H+ antiporter
MEDALSHFAGQAHWSLLGLWIVVCLFLLGKGADLLVVEAVALSERSGIPKIVIGATIVSIGTTAPEAAVSVLAAIQGNPGLALGNAVGSVICDTGLILGLATIIAPLTIDRRLVNRQGWIQLGAGLLLILACVPFFSSTLNPSGIFSTGGNLPQFMGFVFLALLLAYLWISVRWSRQAGSVNLEEFEGESAQRPNVLVILKLIGSIIIVVGSARLLIPGVTEAAVRLHVPDSVIAATLVAFGTSLPELVTAVTAARKGHGELAIGNVVGADILNVLFVAGAAAAVTGGGLDAGPHFFRLLFPAMLGVLIVFRVGILASGDQMKRGFGFVLLIVYGLVTVLSYLFPEFQVPSH